MPGYVKYAESMLLRSSKKKKKKKEIVELGNILNVYIVFSENILLKMERKWER